MVALFIGIWLVAVGLIRIIAAFEEPQGRRASRIIVAVVDVAAGVVIVATPGIGYAMLALIVGIAFIVNGLALSVLDWGCAGSSTSSAGRCFALARPNLPQSSRPAPTPASQASARPPLPSERRAGARP